MRAKFEMLLLVLIAVLLNACGGGRTGVIAPLQAQPPVFSNATLKGTYIVSYSGGNLFVASPMAVNGMGTVVADGNGNITGGTVIEFQQVPPPSMTTCIGTPTYILSGSYSIAGDGTGSATIKFTGTCSGGGTPVPFTANPSLTVTQSGSGFVFADGGNGIAGTGLKQ